VSRRTGEQVNRCPSRYDRSTGRKQAWNEILILVTRIHCLDYHPVSAGTHGCWILQSWQCGMKQTTDRLLVSVRPTAEQELPIFRLIRFRLPVHDVFRDPDHWIVSSIFSAILFNLRSLLKGGTGWRSWWTHCATSLKLPGSIPDGVVGIFHWPNPSGPVVDSTCNISDYQFPEGKADRYEGLTTFQPSYAHCLEILGKVPGISFPLWHSADRCV
jgi:hypothetical protein